MTSACWQLRVLVGKDLAEMARAYRVRMPSSAQYRDVYKS
jgi:hypothetical protein